MAKLNWHPITRGGEPAGELLGAFELYLNEGAELPFMPPTRQDVYQVPSGIRPVMQLTRIEVSLKRISISYTHHINTSPRDVIEDIIKGQCCKY